GKQLRESRGHPAWKPRGKDPRPEPPFTSTLPASGTAPGEQTRTCTSAAGLFDCPVLREPTPKGSTSLAQPRGTLTGWECVHLVLRACRIIGNEGLIIACQPAAVITLLPQTHWGPSP
ncbi:Mediator of RNA polymerase II transcription subunit 17, partial [Dissostichus eleginoides]